MNKHNKSLGNSSTKGPALNTGKDNKIKSKIGSSPRRHDLLLDTKVDLDGMREVLVGIDSYLHSDPTRQASPQVIKWMKNACATYKGYVERSIGMPGYSDSVTTQTEASPDIPTVPLGNYQLVHRVCYIAKTANSGTSGGGFFSQLNDTDLAPFVSPSSGTFFRVKKVTSWTVPRADGSVTQGTFAGVAVPGSAGTNGEIMPIWSENWTPVGKGFAGIVTLFPLGDFPLFTTGGAAVPILNHFTSLGGVGGIEGVPVVFHVEIETLI
jgi:hypothetical protein